MFVFDVGGKEWKSYNWTVVTTVAAFGKYDAELMCYAHSKGARLVLKGKITSCLCEGKKECRIIIIFLLSGAASLKCFGLTQLSVCNR